MAAAWGAVAAGWLEDTPDPEEVAAAGGQATEGRLLAVRQAHHCLGSHTCDQSSRRMMTWMEQRRRRGTVSQRAGGMVTPVESSDRRSTRVTRLVQAPPL